MSHLLILAAIKPEIEDLVNRFRGKWQNNQARFTLDENLIDVVLTGVGMINTAHTLSSCLKEGSYQSVWMIGSCGSYREEIQIGDVLIAEEEINGDLGISQSEGWKSPSLFPFAIVERAGKSFYNRFPCQVPQESIWKDLSFSNFGLTKEKMLSTSTVSGCFSHARLLQERFQAAGENMEGAAAAQVSLLHNLPFLEIRSVSNVAGQRDKSQWNFSLSARHSQEVIISLLEHYFHLGKDFYEHPNKNGLLALP